MKVIIYVRYGWKERVCRPPVREITHYALLFSFNFNFVRTITIHPLLLKDPNHVASLPALPPRILVQRAHCRTRGNRQGIE